MVLDSHRVWLILRSSTLPNPEEIGKAVGLKSQKTMRGTNVGAEKIAPGRRSFMLQSDLDIPETESLDIHLQWMHETCRSHLPAIREFLMKEGNFGEVFVYVITDQGAAYVELENTLISEFARAKLSFNIKIEVE